MRSIVLSKRPPRQDLPLALLGALLLTLAVFLVLPLTQMVSSRAQRLRMLTPVLTAELPPESQPDEPSPPPPEPEPPPEPPPPVLADAAQPLNLNVSLEVALGSGGAYAGLVDSPLGDLTQTGGLSAFDVAELEKPPELLAAVPPDYPPALRQAGVEGTVSVLLVLDENGQVEDVRVERSSRSEFEAPALAAVRKWRFRPGMKDGQPVRTFVRQRIRFSLSR